MNLKGRARHVWGLIGMHRNMKMMCVCQQFGECSADTLRNGGMSISRLLNVILRIC